MQIKNNTDRTLDVKVAGKSSQTLWEAQVTPGTSVIKELPDGDKPFTVTGRWSANPPLGYNWLVGDHYGAVPSNNATITVDAAYPAFKSSAT
jgi:hypothetical protein